MVPFIIDDRGIAGTKALAPAIFVTGKGGVGKTTVAAGIAVAAAREGKGAIFVEFGESDSGELLFGESYPEVDYHCINADEALITHTAPLFGSAWLAKAVLGNFAMRPLLKAAPAVRELFMLEAVRHLVETNPGKRVVVDMPATGHSLSWLAVPRQGRDLIGSGPMFEVCDRLVRELIRPGGMSLIVVAIPEPLVLRETRELCIALSSTLGLPVDRMFVNRVPAAPTARAVRDLRAIADGNNSLAQAAQSLFPVLKSRLEVRDSVINVISDTFGGKAPMTVMLPRAPKSPTPADVAQWLMDRDAI